MRTHASTTQINTATIIEDYKKALEQRDKVIQLQQELIEMLKLERCKILNPSVN